MRSLILSAALSMAPSRAAVSARPLSVDVSNSKKIGAIVGAAIRPHSLESHAPQNGNQVFSMYRGRGLRATDSKCIVLRNPLRRKEKGWLGSHPGLTCNLLN